MIITRFADTEPRRDWLSPRGQLLARNIGEALSKQDKLDRASVIIASPEPAAVMTAMAIAHFIPDLPVVRTLPELHTNAVQRYIASVHEDNSHRLYGDVLRSILMDQERSINNGGTLVVISSAMAIQSLIEAVPSLGVTAELDQLRAQAGWVSELQGDPLAFTSLLRVAATREH